MPTIFGFSSDILSSALSNDYTTSESIKQKKHFSFLLGYLTSIGAKTIVIEEDYVSKDFLHDYAAYYAFCFENYPKNCKRIHFFKNDFTSTELDELLLQDESQNDFNNNYLGFIVVKPIPQKIIGFTLLKTYDEVGSRRTFFGTRDYDIHFFGNKIKVQSLAFQEQDSVVAACATTAIWSMLSKASKNSYSILKTPFQITKEAGNLSPNGSRLFPNKGLNIHQIANVIYLSGLEPEIKQGDFILHGISKVSATYLKSILNAYSPIGIPIILIIAVPNGGQHGLHAITVSGFNTLEMSPLPPNSNISLLSSNINKFYAHDDQWGPFCKIEFEEMTNSIITPWDNAGLNSYVLNAIVPVYPKMRITYEDIFSLVLGLDRIFKLFFNNNISYNLLWDIKIQFSDDYKNKIKLSSLEDLEKLNFIKSNLPKYVWVASCYVGMNKIFDFIFDATDINSAMIGIDFFCYIVDAKDEIKTFLESNRSIFESLLGSTSGSLYYDFLISKLYH